MTISDKQILVDFYARCAILNGQTKQSIVTNLL